MTTLTITDYLQDTTTGLTLIEPSGRQRHYIIQPVAKLHLWEVYSTHKGAPIAFIGTVIDFRNHADPCYRELGLHWSPAPQPSYNTAYYLYWSLFGDWLAGKNIPCKQLAFCKRCGQLLTTAKAIERGYGPHCYEEHIAEQTRQHTSRPPDCQTCKYLRCTEDEELLCRTCPVGTTFVDGCECCACSVLHNQDECPHYTRRK